MHQKNKGDLSKTDIVLVKMNIMTEIATDIDRLLKYRINVTVQAVFKIKKLHTEKEALYERLLKAQENK
jgi:hypothetical protein